MAYSTPNPPHHQWYQLKVAYLPSYMADKALREIFRNLTGFMDLNLVRFTEWTCQRDYRIIGDCTGLAFVKFATEKDMDEAFRFFTKAKEFFEHGLLIGHREVQIQIALPNTPDFCVKVVVYGIPAHWAKTELQAHLEAFGIIESVGLDVRRRGHVIFRHRASAEAAVLLSKSNTETWSADGTLLRLRVLLVDDLA